MLFGITANASVLGTETIKHARIDIGKGAVLETNVFYGDQSGVGNQSEYFVEYTPNDNLVPTVITGDIYGYRTISTVAKELMESGESPTLLMNSDFFALNTGVPLSHHVINGMVTVMDTNDMDAIGFNYDGTAFISHLDLDITIQTEDSEIEVGALNKLRQPYALYMYTDNFSATTKAETKGINIVLKKSRGDLRLGSKMTAVVESISEDEGAVAIEDGKIVLSIDMNAPTELVEAVKTVEEGDYLSIVTKAEGDKRWEDAKHILGVWGERLIKDSEITKNDEAAAPRTAFGIKKDGTLIFYTLDGRNPGHSYGARIQTLAKRLLELGCVDAVNLDGGGSTTIGTAYPGKDSFDIINKPSDGYERKVATVIGLVNTAPKSTKAEKLFIYPYTENYLSGATENFSAYATDKNYYRVPLTEEVVYTAPDGSTSTDGKLKITGDGKVAVKAKSGKLTSQIELSCYDTPTSVAVVNASNGNSVSSIILQPNRKMDLNAYAYVGNKALIGDDTCFTWQAKGDIGSIDKNGHFTASEEDGEGAITISAGDYTKTIDVKVKIISPYLKVNFEDEDKGKITVSFESDEGKAIWNSDISLKVDGEDTEVNLVANKLTLEFDDDKTHKINITAKNTDEYITVASYTVEGEDYDNGFVDIKDSHWAKSYITYMNNFGIINGIKENGKIYFKPQNNVTRGQFAVMIANATGVDLDEYEDAELKFDDADSIADWCAPHIQALCSMGIMNGKENNGKLIFDPNAPLTRAEAITVISRLIPDNVKTEEKTFADSKSIPTWSKNAFNKLASLGIINGYSDNTIKPKNNITRAEAVKLIYSIY